MALALTDLGVLAHHQRGEARAPGAGEESLAFSRAIGSKWFVSLSLAYLRLIAQELGDAQRATRLFVEILALCRDRGAWPAGHPLPAAPAIDELLTVARANAAGDLAGARWGLTPCEVEVLRLLAVGYADREIAAALYISHRTVHHHVAKVYAKLGVRNRAAAHIARGGAGLVS